MSNSEEEIKLERCLESCIKLVQETINQLKVQGQLQENASLTDIALDVNIHSFTLNTGEEALMGQLKINLESILVDHLPSLSKYCRKYLLDLLYEFNYNYDEREFTSPFNIGILDSFTRDLQSILASIKAFQAAWNGDLPSVQEFIKKYPAIKDKSGLWGTTLLYSAARNNHLVIVQFLVKIARCSVNAQNQQHIMRALSAATITDDDFYVNPTAGSTALHGACFYGYLDVVKFLIEYRADYFLTNHVEETPIMNAGAHPDIIHFFRDFLIVGYSSKLTNLPDKPILEINQPPIIDCIWEYKPFADETWFPFSVDESSKLQKSLLVDPDQEFKRDIHLQVRKGLYSVSMMTFLRSGKDMDSTQNLAWVRCRGSSILNFDCYALWQIMFVKHPEGTSDSTLEMLSIPTIYDSRFKIHLNSWYYCDARTNNQLDRTINYRRKHIKLDLPFISKHILKFDLQTFSFYNQQKDITGFIRWIPKLISNNARHKDKIISIDQYQILANMDPIPLTTARLKQISIASDSISIGDEEEIGEINNNDDDSLFESNSQNNNDDVIDTSDKIPETPTNGPRSLNDIFNAANSTSDNTTSSKNPFLQASSFNFSSTNSSLTTDLTSDDVTEKNIDDCINETAANCQRTRLVERINPSNDNEISATMSNELVQLKQEKEKLKATLDQERAKVQNLLDSEGQQTAKHEEELSKLMEHIDLLQREKKTNKKKKQNFEKLQIQLNQSNMIIFKMK